MKKCAVVILNCMLLACGVQKTETVNVQEDQVNPTQFTEQLEVSPEMLGVQAYELGALIKNLMPDMQKEQHDSVWEWDALANDAKILWKTEGYKEFYDPNQQKTLSERYGLVRVHQQGERVSELRDRKYEVPWRLQYTGYHGKFGVHLVSLMPEIDEMVTFPDPDESLKKQSIKITTICMQSAGGGAIRVLALDARKKQTVYLIDHISAGSGGESRWLELSLEDLSTEWCPDGA